ncbi:MAG TPA: serine/threonine-protein kinase, partial [Phycisphaerae bacterium]|nr:serine/threonine-protein kinase [Phycisphaerae bacterium]
MKAPSDETLARYVLGTADEEEAALVERYLESDSSGYVRLERVRADDELLTKLRAVMSADQMAAAQAVTVASEGPAGVVRSDVPTVPYGRAGSSGQDSGWAIPVTRGPGPAHIEGYEILEELGRGGMGVVYTAVQQSTKRKVALKVLLEGPFASTAAKRRFEREVELAARLSHPNIVTILESGVASGRYYFAMQYIEGVTLTRYMHRVDRTRAQTLEIFAQICRAVSYAHQRGIIHRDLKPSNILIDAEGKPYVLDFGLAKPADTYADDLEQSRALSLTGQLMGTLPYMSPEQASGQNQQVDIRTDIYSLGVMLYEVLTGEFPYAVVGHVADVLRNIQQTIPRRPSTVQRRINDELETIVLKALAKEPERRYQSAEGLAKDLEAFLTGAPIEAKRDSSLYVMRKLLRRHYRLVGAVALIVVLLAAGGWITARQRARLADAEAERLLAAFVEDAAAGKAALAGANAGVRERVHTAAAKAVSSPAGPQRVLGAASALWTAPEAFWASVDGGPLWTNGEWLEVCRHGDAVGPALLERIANIAAHGTDRQRYVAWCLLGALTSEKELSTLGLEGAAEQGVPGIAAAAAWAQGRGPAAGGDAVFHDDVTGLTFVRVPADEAFSRGSPPTDPHRFDDEDRGAGIAISAIYVAQTEVTWAAWQAFLADEASEGVYGSDARAGMRTLLASVPEAQRDA